MTSMNSEEQSSFSEAEQRIGESEVRVADESGGIGQTKTSQPRIAIRGRQIDGEGSAGRQIGGTER